MNYRNLSLSCIVIGVLLSGSAFAWSPLPVDDDPLVRMPGSQPDALANVAAPSHEVKGGGAPNYVCINCHKGDPVAPADQGQPFAKWQGSMMAQAARDPIFWATMTVAAQDSIWAIGRPNATDICLRCHFPEGWMSDRSEELNASAMTGSDYDGVHCGVCHKLYDPFAQATNAGTREGGINQQAYWDEATSLSSTEADATAAADSLLAQAVTYFNAALGSLFDGGGNPLESGYTENGGGQMFMDLVSDPWDNMRGPFADPLATAHEANNLHYSRYHKSRYFCSTCHDVSNPVLTNLGDDPTNGLISEQQSAHTYSHVERTFSEFMSSAYSQDNGIQTNQEFQNLGGVAVAGTCQDCHMANINGVAAASGAEPPIRPDDSTEHVNSGISSHDLQGGNMWMTRILASLDESLGSLHDTINLALLNQGSDALTLDFTQGIGITSDNFGDALLAASDRAKSNLQRAATLKNVAYNSVTGELTFRVQNNTGHKLLTGYPEGRRIWLNVKAYSGQEIVYEINPYDDLAGTFKGGLDFWNYNGDDGKGGTIVPSPAALAVNEEFRDELIYEAVTKSSLTGENHSFHFALSDERYKDNRIPPKFFNLTEAANRLAEPVASGGVKDSPASPGTNLYTATEYAGGYDAVSVIIPDAAYKNITNVKVSLNYQGTSREYVEFLRDEINGTGSNRALFGPDNVIGIQNQTYAQVNGLNLDSDNAYLIQADTDPADFFYGLRSWGETIWELWYHNHGLDTTGTAIEGLTPFEMTSAQAAAENTAIYTIELIGDGLGSIIDTVSTVTLCDKPSAAPVTCDIPYVVNTSIDYTAIEGTGSSFAGFTGSAVINGSQLTDTVTVNETIQAAFMVTIPDTIIYTLELFGDGLGYIKDTANQAVLCNKATADIKTCSLPYQVGTSIAFTAVAGKRTVFDGYTGNATFNGTELSDTTDSNETIQGSFRHVPPMNIVLQAASIIAAEKAAK